MGKIIDRREFMKVMVKTRDGRQLYQLCGDSGETPVMFIDTIEGFVYKHHMQTASNDFYIKEKIDNGI